MTPAPARVVCPLCSARFDVTQVTCPHDGSPLLTWSEDPLLGTQIDGRFALNAQLGEGGMGAVYAACQTSVERLVAVKLIKPALVDNEDTTARFLREARLAARVAHPNVVGVIDSGCTDARLHYLVLEFLRGPTLAQVIAAEAPLSSGRAVRIATQICQALDAAHALGVVHRDLKPQNLVLLESTDDFVKVLDFGLARSLAGDDTTITRDGVLFGTPAYMPPEVARGQGCDARGDLYALGVVLYEMLAGKRPFSAANPVAMAMHQAYHQPPPLPDRIEPALVRVVERLLAKAPDDRYPTAASAAAALEDALRAAPAPIVEEIAVPPPSWRGPAVALGLALVAGLAWWGARDTGPTPTAGVAADAAQEQVLVDAVVELLVDAHAPDAAADAAEDAADIEVDAGVAKRVDAAKPKRRRKPKRKPKPAPKTPPAEDFLIPSTPR